MSSSDALAASSLKDLLKICRSHSILLPEVLPKDKQYYIDLIVRHRTEAGKIADDPFADPFASADAIEAASVDSGAGGSGAAAGDEDDWGASQSSLAALRASSASFGNDDDFVEVSRAAAAPSAPETQRDEEAPLADRHVQVRHRGSKSSAAGAGAAAAPPVYAFDAASSAPASSAFPAPSAPPTLASSSSYAAAAAAAASLLPQPSAPLDDSSKGLPPGEAALAAHDVVYDEEELEFTRTPAVQRITAILADIALFDWLESRTGVKRFYCFMLGVSLACAGLLTYIGALAVANFICFVYPAYQTYKTLEGKYLPESLLRANAEEGEDWASVSGDASVEVHRYWLTYWCVYGLFKLIEFLADVILAPWVPYYEPAKVAFLVWSFHPSSQGCALVYAWVIRPAFLPREEGIDRAIERLLDSTQQAGREAKAIILKKVAKRIAGEDGSETPNKERARAAAASQGVAR